VLAAQLAITLFRIPKMKVIENFKKSLAAGVVLKNMKQMEGLDGLAWSCSVYLDGKKIGTVFDGGNGGPLSVEIDAGPLSQLVKALKAVEYPLNLDLGEGLRLDEPTTDYGYVELVLPNIADEHDTVKRIKRAASQKMLITQVGDEEGTYWPLKAPYTAQNAQLVREHYGQKLVCIVNELLIGL
jgi:hypothetical protein